MFLINLPKISTSIASLTINVITWDSATLDIILGKMKMASNSAKLNFLNRLRFTGCKENYLRALFMKSSVTVFEMPMKRFPPGSQSNSSIGTLRKRARTILKPNQVAPRDGEEEERGPTDGVTPPREANQRRGARGTRGGGIERRASAGGGSR